MKTKHVHHVFGCTLIALIGILLIAVMMRGFTTAEVVEDQAANLEAAAAAAR